MKNFLKITNSKTNEDIVLFNLDKFTGKVAFTLMVVGAIRTYKVIKSYFTKETENNAQN